MLQMAGSAGKRPDGFYGVRLSGRLGSMSPPVFTPTSPTGGTRARCRGSARGSCTTSGGRRRSRARRSASAGAAASTSTAADDERHRRAAATTAARSSASAADHQLVRRHHHRHRRPRGAAAPAAPPEGRLRARRAVRGPPEDNAVGGPAAAAAARPEGEPGPTATPNRAAAESPARPQPSWYFFTFSQKVERAMAQRAGGAAPAASVLAQ